MHVFVSIDMEGIAGVATLEQTTRGRSLYPHAQRLMTSEANAVIGGAFDAGARTVTVNDSHGTMDNLLHDELDPRARIVFGAPKADCMMQGLGPEHDVALLVGYHAAAGVQGTLAHTISYCYSRVRVDGRTVAETDINALMAAAAGVPIGLVTGDDVTCAAAAALLPCAHIVEVKKAVGQFAADSLSPSAAAELLQQGAAVAVAAAATLPAAPIPEDLEVELEVKEPDHAERLRMIPGFERIDVRTVRGMASNAYVLSDILVLGALLDPLG